MNVRKPIVEPQAGRPARFLQVAFNQDDSCFSGATEDGFMIYNTDPLACKLTKRFQEADNSNTSGAGGGIGYTRMLYRTNYTALVGGGRKPRYPLNKLVIWDDLQQRESVILKFMSPIRQVFLSRIHVVVVLESTVEVFQFNNTPKRICPSLEIASLGTVDFVVTQARYRRGSQDSMGNGGTEAGSSGVNGVIAFPSARSVGQVHIADLARLKRNDQNPEGTQLLPTSIIKAHKTPIRFLRLNHQGTMVATCSEQGTLIRVFSVHNGTLIKEFRRGSDKADIYEMSFSPKGTKLAVVSDKQTLHVFQVSTTKEAHASEEITRNKTHALKNLVPTGWKPKYLDSVWSMCSVHLRNPMLRDGDSDARLRRDRCKIGWCKYTGNDNGNDYDEEDSIVLVWRMSGIWEKYVMLEKEAKQVYTAQETLRNEQNGSTAWELVREAWREL